MVKAYKFPTDSGCNRAGKAPNVDRETVRLPFGEISIRCVYLFLIFFFGKYISSGAFHMKFSPDFAVGSGNLEI